MWPEREPFTKFDIMLWSVFALIFLALVVYGVIREFSIMRFLWSN